MNTNLYQQLVKKFHDKEYRDAYVSEYIYSRVPLKIRSMRETRHMTQSELGQKAKLAQPWVSKLEDPNYGRLTISTLLRIASALDVGLYVDFVPFSEILSRSSDLTRESFQVPSFTTEIEAMRPILNKKDNAFESRPEVSDRLKNIFPIDAAKKETTLYGQPAAAQGDVSLYLGEEKGGINYAACVGSSRQSSGVR